MIKTRTNLNAGSRSENYDIMMSRLQITHADVIVNVVARKTNNQMVMINLTVNMLRHEFTEKVYMVLTSASITRLENESLSLPGWKHKLAPILVM